MMLKPERVWKVGDETFTDYQDAMRHLRKNKNLLFRTALSDFIADLIVKEPYGKAELDVADRIADALLARYTMKERK